MSAIRRASAAALALLLGASPAFAITGMFEGEPAPERTLRARAEPLTGSPAGYVGYAPPAAVEPPATSIPSAEPLPSAALPASAAAEAAQAQDAPEREAARAEARRLLMTDTMNPIPEPSIEQVDRLGPAAHELLHHRFVVADQANSSDAPEDARRAEYDFYGNRPREVAREAIEGESGAATQTEPAPLEPSAPAPSRARIQELLQRARKESARLSKFWSRGRPARVRAAGQYFPLTYSLDSEFGADDALRIIERDPGSLAELDEALGPPVATTQMAARLGLDVKRLERFALKPGVERGAAAYRYSELRPSYFGEAMASSYNAIFGGLQQATNELRRLAGQAASRVGLPRKSGDEGVDSSPVPLVVSASSYDLELAHASWEEVPRLFGSLIRRLHRGLSMPQTHLHVGLPSAIGKDATVAVARAVETLMILELASAPPSQLEEQPFRYSTLSRDAYDRTQDARGLINLMLGEWKKPHLSDNLELRFYPDIETGLRWQALAATLAQKHKRLKVYPGFGPRWAAEPWSARDDSLTVNLSAALEYAARLLGDSPEADTRQVADDLRLLSAAAGRQLHGPGRDVSLELREKIARYLRSRRVRERMTTDVFLKPAISRRSSPTTP